MVLIVQSENHSGSQTQKCVRSTRVPSWTFSVSRSTVRIAMRQSRPSTAREIRHGSCGVRKVCVSPRSDVQLELFSLSLRSRLRTENCVRLGIGMRYLNCAPETRSRLCTVRVTVRNSPLKIKMTVSTWVEEVWIKYVWHRDRTYSFDSSLLLFRLG